MAKKKKKQKDDVDDLPVQFFPIPKLRPDANERFIVRAPELNRKIGNLIRAWHGFKNAPADEKKYWHEIYIGCINGIEQLHKEINQ